MAWWDSQHRSPGASPRSRDSRPRLIMGDVFPRLEPTHIDHKHIDMERERALLSPVFEEQLGPPTTPALVVHVDIRFTDPVIRSRYCRSYGSSPGLEATNRICRGLVRRIERCSEELITRKDSGALEVFKGDTYERKPQRFEMTFRVIRRGKGEWAERTYRSYQKQPLTVAHTKEVTLAVHRMIGLFLRRHDENFQWLDSPASETDSEGSETIPPSRDGPLSILSVPRSRFVEATQSFEFVPGYNIELCFRNRNPQRQIPTFERRIRVTSAQTTPLTLFMSEDMLWKALQFANQGLDSKKRDFDDHFRDHRALDAAHPEDDTLELSLRVSNNLGPAYSHVQRNIKSKLALFRDPAAKDCDVFLCGIERYLSHIRNEADAVLNGMNDLELRIVELKGVGWTLREPAKFTLGPSASYGRRTIQAALDRIHTGIGDVIRGHNIAIHVNAHKRGHLVLDKAIVAHEKRGKPQETFSTHEDAQAAFVARLKARIQKDMDKVFEDSCAIDDIPEDEDDYFAARPVTPQQPEQAVFEGPSPRYSPSSVRSSPAKRPALGALQSSPRPRAQRVFSLSRRSTESVRSIDYLKAARESFVSDSSRPTSAVSEQVSEPREVGSPMFVPEALGPLLAAAEVRPARSFSLVSRRPSSTIRVSNASTLVEEQTVVGSSSDGQNVETAEEHRRSEESRAVGSMTSSEASPAAAPSGALPVEATPAASLASNPAVQELEVPLGDGDSKDAPATVPQKKQGKMDTPEAFVDAREYAASPASQEVIKSELSGALAGVASPKEDDEFSTAPSTPELSTGASSPRHSVLITPVYQRTSSDAKDPALRKLYPAPEPEDAAVDLQREPDSKDDRDRDPLTTESPIDQNTSLQLTTEPTAAAAEAPEDVPSDTNTQEASESPDPAARVVSRDQTPDSNTNNPPLPSTTPSLTEDTNTNSQTTSGTQVYTAAPVGAEPSTTEPDSTPHAPPDSEVGESGVRGSGPSGDQHASGLPPVSSSKVESVLGPADRLESASSSISPSPFESAGCGVPPPGSELGAGEGAEAEAVEEEECSNPRDDPGPEVDGVEGLVGGEGAGDGAGLVADERGEEEPPDGELSVGDVGPVEEAEGVSGARDFGVRVPEVVAKGDLEESAGPGSDADAKVESEDVILDSVAHPVGAALSAMETSVEGAGDSSDPVATPEHTEHVEPTTAVPEQQVDGLVAAPTDSGAEQDAYLQHEASPDGPEVCVDGVETDDAAGVVSRDVVPEEEEATAPGLGSEMLPDGKGVEDAPGAVPNCPDVADAESMGRDASEAVAVPTEADVAEPDTLGPGSILAEEEPATAPTDVDVLQTKSSEPDATEAEEHTVAAPTAADVVDSESPGSHVGEEDQEASAPVLTMGDVTDTAERVEELIAVPIAIDGAETETTELGARENTKDDLNAVPTVAEVSDTELPQRGIGELAEEESAMTPTMPGAVEPEILADDAGKKIPAPESEVPGPETSGEHLVEADGLSPALTEDVAEKEKSPKPGVVEQELSQGLDVRADGIGGEVAFESDEGSEPHPDARVGNDDDHQDKPLGPDGGIDETGAILDESRKLDIDVCLEPGTPGPESDKHAAPAIPLDDLTPGSGTLGPSTEAKTDSPAVITVTPTESPAKTPTPKPAPAPPQPEKKETPHLAPIPDLSKLANLSPTPTQATLSSSAASFISIDKTRNSVDTIRRSTDSHRHQPAALPTPEHPHTTSNDSNGRSRSNSRPQTAGYLGIGLLGKESRFAEVGLRGALGDVKARRRRMSLPLQHLLDQEREVWPSAPASEAGGGKGSSSKLRRRGLKSGREGGGDDDGGQSVLPRMMMLLAGAVAIGKIMKQVAE